MSKEEQRTTALDGGMGKVKEKGQVLHILLSFSYSLPTIQGTKQPPPAESAIYLQFFQAMYCI